MVLSWVIVFLYAAAVLGAAAAGRGAEVSAAMLDGGSSTMLYYEDYYTKYGIDTATLDQYQLRGLVNKYKAFTNPRRIPTYFMVSGEE